VSTRSSGSRSCDASAASPRPSFLGSGHEVVAALRLAEADHEAAASARDLLDQVPSRRRRELLSVFGAVTWPRPPSRRPSCAAGQAEDEAPADPSPDTESECETMKIICRKFQPLARNTLRGFAEISIVDFGMSMRDVAIHTKNGAKWAQPPAKPQVRDASVVKDDAGKAQYVPIIEFTSRDARDHFSEAMIAAVLATEDGKRALGGQVDADIPF
jgi:hypothetical protein